MKRRELKQKHREYIASSREAGLAVVMVSCPKRWLRDVRDNFAEFGYKLEGTQRDPSKRKWVICRGVCETYETREMKLSEARPHFAPDAGTTYAKKGMMRRLLALTVRVVGVLPDPSGWSNIGFFANDPNEGRLCGNLFTPYSPEAIARHISQDILIVGQLAPWLAYNTTSEEHVIPLVGLVVDHARNESEAIAAWERFKDKGPAKIAQVARLSRSIANKTYIHVTSPSTR